MSEKIISKTDAQILAYFIDNAFVFASTSEPQFWEDMYHNIFRLCNE